MKDGVAIVIESLRGGGAQHVASVLANEWTQQGVAVTVITLLTADTDFFSLDPRIRRIVIPDPGASSNSLTAVASNLIRIRRLRAALKTCMCGTIVSFIGSMNVLTVLAARWLGKRVIIAERNDPARQSLGTAWDWLRKRFYRHADIIITNSRAAAETLATYVPTERIIWLPNPLRETGSSQMPLPVPRPFMLAVGRLERQKAFDVLLAAFAEVSAALSGWSLAILGDGALRESLQKQAMDLGIAPRVIFAGHISDPGPWYRQARMLVHPARFEGLPNVVLEAMNAACPVIVTDAQVGLREFVRNGDTGLVVPVESSGALADAMLQLANNAELGAKLGRAARDAVAPCRTEKAVAAWSAAVFGSQAVAEDLRG